MKFNLYLLCCCLLVRPAVAQLSAASPSDIITVTQHQPVSVTYENIDELSADKLIPDAFTLNFNSPSAACRVYCNVVFTGKPNEALAQQIVLKPSGPAGNNNQLRLSLNPQLLIDHRPGAAAMLQYDAVIKRQTTRIAPGNYDFSIQFTIHQP